MDFTISHQPLSDRIYIGTVDKTGTVFRDKEDATERAVAAVAQYVLSTYPEGMTLRRRDGSGWEIDVKEIPAPAAPSDAASPAPNSEVES